MKRNKWLQKLLAVGLAAAMTIASLTGPGSVTNPEEVKAEEEQQQKISLTNAAVELEGITKDSAGNYTVIYDGQSHKPTSVTVTPQGATSSGAIKILSDDVAGLTLSYKNENGAEESDFVNAGTITVTVSATTGGAVTSSAVTGGAVTYEGTASTSYKIVEATLTKDNVSTYLDYTVPESAVYTGEAFTASVQAKEGITGTGKLTLSYKKVEGENEVSVEKAVDVGTYRVYVSAEGGTNVNATSTGIYVGAFTITKAPDTKPAEPTISPATRTFTTSLEVTITASEADKAAGAKIYYTTDGTDPSKNSKEYTKPFTVTATTTVKAVVVRGDQASDVESVTYTKSSGTGGNTGGWTGGGTGGSTGGSTGGTTGGNTTGTTTETKPDGTKVETSTETKPDGTKVETTTEKKTDGTTTITVKEKETNAAGKEVAVETKIEKDASGKVTAETTTSVIAKADKDTSATVTVVKDSTGAQTAAAEVIKTGTTNKSGSVKGSISAAVVSQVVAAAGTSDVTITQTVTDAAGDTKFTVAVNAKNLVSGETLKIMKLDPKTGEYVLCNKKDYVVSGAGDVSLTIKTEGDFILLSEADAKAASDKVLETVKVKKSSATVKPGKTTTVAMSSKLNKKNVSKITYTVSNKSVATVDKNGKVKANKAGTVTVKAKVTLKNGKTKTVKMTIKVK